MNILMVIGPCLSLLTSFVAIVVVITNLRANVDSLKDQERRMTEKVEESTRDVTRLLVEVKSFISEQTTINRFVSKTLESVVDRCDDCRDIIHKQDNTAALLAE